MAKAQVYDNKGESAPGLAPKPILGNLLDIYQAENQLSAYNALHHKFGAVVRILWLWRYQLSVASYPMALHILGENQYHYEKFPPNTLLRKFYGESVLTQNGAQWKRHRLILNEFFTEKSVAVYHKTIEEFTQQLIEKWQTVLSEATEDFSRLSENTLDNKALSADIDSVEINLSQTFSTLFLDIITQITVGEAASTLDVNTDEFLQNLAYIIKASTKPQYQFVSWWQALPLKQNHQLSQALTDVDTFLERLISHHQSAVKQTSKSTQKTVLSKLLKSSEKTLDCPLTHAEVKANLLAIIGNGYETVSTTLAMTLQALVQHPDALAHATQEAQLVLEKYGQRLPAEATAELPYLEAVLYESMRLYPAVAGLQRISLTTDRLDNWSIPAGQAVGITLQPLHLDSEYYGDEPEVFRPERYLQQGFIEAHKATQVLSQSPSSSASRCPFGQLLSKTKTVKDNQATVLPLTFGHGARQCIAKHLALYEMKIVLAMLLNAFEFTHIEAEPVELELGKFGLFISAHPKTAITLKISLQTASENSTDHQSFQPNTLDMPKVLVYQ